jgi:hypothetical protein
VNFIECALFVLAHCPACAGPGRLFPRYAQAGQAALSRRAGGTEKPGILWKSLNYFETAATHQYTNTMQTQFDTQQRIDTVS